MSKKCILLPLMLSVFLFPIHAQVFGEVEYDVADTVIGINYDRGFTAQIETTSNLFQMTNVSFSDAKERDRRTGYSLINNYPFGRTNILDGTVVRFGYNTGWFGGAFSVKHNEINDVKAWLSLLDGMFRISVGNITYSFADSQGAPAGLRIYDDHVRNVREGEAENPAIDSNKNPDNITGGKGVLLEFLLDPITIALAAGGNFADTGRVLMVRSNSAFTQEAVFGHSLNYGLNIGSLIGDFARVNAAYVFESEKKESQYTYNSSIDSIIATRSDAHIMTHQFGLFGSIYPFRDDSLGFTAGYAGVLVQYLDEFGAASKTIKPQVLKHGINLSARYRIGDFTIRTDHNYSFWADKNYRIFNLHKPNVNLRDWGLVSSDTVADNWGDVHHSFLWNGIGFSYRFTQMLEGSISARNLLRIDKTSILGMTNNYFAVEVRTTFRFDDSVEAFIGFVFDHTARSTNEALSVQTGEFPGAFTPRETFDTRFMVQIPVGLTIRLQK
ncbi:MAG: hypothetical protein LBC80_03915 [Treponema sp.]|jgi:hypothetical protein|nr:hypothetical protein [Treponema sp.]